MEWNTYYNERIRRKSQFIRDVVSATSNITDMIIAIPIAVSYRSGTKEPNAYGCNSFVCGPWSYVEEKIFSNLKHCVLTGKSLVNWKK